MRVYERVRGAADAVFVAVLGCPAGRWMVLRARRFIALFSPVTVLVWFIGLMVGLSGSAVLLALDGSRAAVVITDLRETDGLAVQGGRLNILTGTDKRRDCPTTTSRFLWRWVADPDDPAQRIKLYVPLLGPPVPLASVGTERSILSVPLPSDIQPGDGWHYQSKSMRECPVLPALAGVVVSQSPNVPLQVLTEREAAGIAPQEGTVTRPDLRP